MQYTVGVRALCEFTARAGDLNLRSTPSPTALEGMAGHGWVTGRRGAGYETEVPLEAEHAGVRVRGRADGFDAAQGRLEEIKTHRGDLARQSAHQRTLHAIGEIVRLREHVAHLVAAITEEIELIATRQNQRGRPHYSQPQETAAGNQQLAHGRSPC